MKKDADRVPVVVVLPLLRSLRPGGILLSDRGSSCKTSSVLGRKIVLVSLGICARRVALDLLLPLWVVCQVRMPFLSVESFFGETCCRLLLKVGGCVVLA